MRKFFTVVLAVLLVAASSGPLPAVDADFSQAMLFNDEASPDTFRLSNVEVLQKFYWGLFQWDSGTNSLDLVGSGREAGPAFEIPTRMIVVDGNAGDWTGLAPVLVSPAGNDLYGMPGDDITDVFIARDNDFMYFGMRIVDGPPLSGGNGHLHFQFSLTAAGWNDLIQLENHFAVFISVLNNPIVVDTALHVVNPVGENGAMPVSIAQYDPGSHLGVGTDFVEWKVPVEDCMVTSGRYAEAWTHYEGNPTPSDVVLGVRLQ